MRFTEEKGPFVGTNRGGGSGCTPGHDVRAGGRRTAAACSDAVSKMVRLGERLRLPGLDRQPELAIANMDVLLLTSRCEDSQRGH